jgi:hypothetical protein
MKVFISWSGQKSKYVAAKLKSWLPLVLHFIDPWMSEKDIFAGDRWSKELAESLQDTKFGIVVLTGSNRESSWIHFEAGALSKSVDEAKIIPYLRRQRKRGPKISYYMRNDYRTIASQKNSNNNTWIYESSTEKYLLGYIYF